MYIYFFTNLPFKGLFDMTMAKLTFSGIWGENYGC